MISNLDLYDGAYGQSDFPTKSEWRFFSEPELLYCPNYAFITAIFWNSLSKLINVL